jgi:hypothetical protein
MNAAIIDYNSARARAKTPAIDILIAPHMNVPMKTKNDSLLLLTIEQYSLIRPAAAPYTCGSLLEVLDLKRLVTRD